MAIIRDKESKFTVQLTDSEQLMWLVFHFGMLPDEAIQNMEENQILQNLKNILMQINLLKLK